MCIAVISLKSYESIPLFIAHNRDEFRKRSALHASDHGKLIYGVDEKSEGTWFAVSKKGQFCFVTNQYTGTPDPAKKSRGDLPIKYLDSNHDDFVSYIRENYKNYNSFNLVFGDVNKVTVFDSRKNKFYEYEKGVFVVATTDSKVLDFKSARLLDHTTKLIDDEKVSMENLEKILLDTKKAPTEEVKHEFS